MVTVIKTAWEPRYPTMKSKMSALRAEIPTITAAELSSIDTTKIGLKGSPTKVKKTFTPSLKKGGKKVAVTDVAECVKGATAFLDEIKVI